MMPDKIGGRPNGKPGFSLTVVSAKPRMSAPDKIGGTPSEYEPEDEQDVTAEQAQDDASREIIAAITSVKPNVKRLKEALRAFVQSCSIGSDSEEEI